MARFPPPFGLDSLMLIIALAGVCTAVFRASPVLGIPLAVLSASALVRMSVQAARGQPGGRRLTPFDKAIQFFVSVAIVLLVGIPAIVAFVLFTAVCQGSQVHTAVSFIGGIAAAGGAGFGGYRMADVAIRQWDW